jgi:hypothetical protein
MNLKDYFETTAGSGVLATADGESIVNTAIYARPHVIDDVTVAFIMNDRRSYANVSANPHAAYLYREDAPGYKGIRLYLTRTVVETDHDMIESMRRKKHEGQPTGAEEPARYLVSFHVDEIRPLAGDQ